MDEWVDGSHQSVHITLFYLLKNGLSFNNIYIFFFPGAVIHGPAVVQIPYPQSGTMQYGVPIPYNGKTSYF